MKNPLKIALTAFALSAFCGLAFAQDEAAAPSDEEIKAAAPARPAPKKASAKKKPVKKKKTAKKKEPGPAPVSEYKFKAADTTPSYKFDRKANPIIKAKIKAGVSSKKGKKGEKGKKSADRNAKKTAEQPAPKLKKTPSFGEEAPANNPENNPANNPANTPEEDQ